MCGNLLWSLTGWGSCWLHPTQLWYLLYRAHRWSQGLRNWRNLESDPQKSPWIILLAPPHRNAFETNLSIQLPKLVFINYHDRFKDQEISLRTLACISPVGAHLRTGGFNGAHSSLGSGIFFFFFCSFPECEKRNNHHPPGYSWWKTSVDILISKGYLNLGSLLLIENWLYCASISKETPLKFSRIKRCITYLKVTLRFWIFLISQKKTNN